MSGAEVPDLPDAPPNARFNRFEPGTLQPLIILATRESGGSLLSALLGAHPAFCAAPSLNLLAFDTLWQLVRFSAIPRESNSQGLLRFIADLTTGEQSVWSIQAALRWIARRKTLNSTDVYSELAGLVAPRRIVDYSPLLALSAEALDRALAAAPEAPVIHLTRNPLTYCPAIGETVWETTMLSMDFWDRRGTYQPPMDLFEIGEQYIDWSTTPPVFDPEFAWARAQKWIGGRLAGRPASRVRHLRVEELARDPARVLRDLLSWLGESAGPKAIESMLGQGVPPIARTGPYNAPFGVDRSLIGRDVKTVLAEISERDRHVRTRRTGRAPASWRGDGEPLLREIASLGSSLGYDLA